MVDPLGVGLGALLTLTVVVLHFSQGTDRPIPDDISQEVIERRAATVPETEFPEPMNRSIGGGGVATAAVGAGAVGEGAELEEGVAEEDDDPAAIPDDEAEVYEIEYVNEGETIDVRENQTLLDAGEESGWDLPYACRQGQCISCAGRVTDGGNSEQYLQHHTNEMLGEEELSEGYTLTCVAYPTSDLSLETRESP
jgi:2Fe-2S type ferredoxin